MKDDETKLDAGAPPQPSRVRKSVRALTAAEKLNYITAVTNLKGQTDPTYGNSYKKYVTWHMDMASMMIAHWTPAFLPWHRYFIWSFEQELRSALPPNTPFTLPYWDWEWDERQTDQADTAVWQPDFMGPAGSPVQTGPFATWKLWRELGTKISTLPTVADVTIALAASPFDIKPYNASVPAGFRNTIEGEVFIPNGMNPPQELHARVHGWVGGHMGAIPISPKDPAFFLHHCNIDRIWAMWQNKNPKELAPLTSTYPTDCPIEGTNLNEQLYPWNNATITPAVMLDYTKIYSYQIEKLYCGFNRSDGCIYFTSSFDGTTWDALTQPPNLGSYNTPAFAQYNGQLWCSFKDGTYGTICHSSFNGTSWSTPNNWDNPALPATGGSPSLAVFGDTIYCAFSSNGCVYIDSTNGYNSGHVQPPNCGSDTTPMLAVFPKLNKIFCAFSHNDGCVYVINSSDGQNWSNRTQPPNAGSYITPGLAAYKDKLYCAYTHNDGCIYVVSSSDGTTWSGTMQPPNAGSTKAPSLTVFNDLLVLAYADGNGNFCHMSYNGNPLNAWNSQTTTNVNIADFPSILSIPTVI